jgi:hypothetical protein
MRTDVFVYHGYSEPYVLAADGSSYMEYIRDRGVYADLPLGTILEALASAYPGFSTDPTTADDPAFSA